MNIVIIKNQKEYDALPKKFTEHTEIIIDAIEPIYEIKTVPKNAVVTLTRQTVVEYLYVTVNVMRGNSKVNVMRGNSKVNVMGGNSKVNVMRDSSQVNVMRDSSQVNVMGGNSKVNVMWGSSQVNVMRDSSQVKAAFENSNIKAFSSSVTILRLKHQSTLICQNCNVNVQEKDNTANIITTKTMRHTKQTFLDIYKDSMTGNSIILYKSVNPETLCDYYTGEIKYEGTVTCPDWDDNEKRECGGGLHLSPTPELALFHNRGKVLKCKVNIEDFVVYSQNISKVRCKKVKVLGEVELTGEVDHD